MQYTKSGPDPTIKDRIYNFNNTGGPDLTMSQWLLSKLKDKYRIYNFNKTGGPDPSMSPWLLAELKDKCPTISLIFDNTYPLDVKTPSLVDNSYFQEIKKGNGVLQIDQQIALGELTKNIVDDIVNDPDFYTKFGDAMVKLGRVEVLIDGQREVRKSCRVVNKKPFIFGGFN
ncbi:hypothetical protein H5410_000995 [Solanum commersonii]|uniref:peroxidase n=1 Tax=Solanum commersonii TaxID=4109 RepID=A0A9J6AXM3_SOLCO|nr:hypothetical protein H5410_000995 [Solanum commersonii]